MSDPVAAVIFDMDGVLIETEHVWDEVREELVRGWGGRYDADAQRAMMGMSSPEWSLYISEALGAGRTPDDVNRAVVAAMLERYERDLPLIDGAVDAVRSLAGAGKQLAIASSSNRELIDTVLDVSGLVDAFAVTVSSEEVARGKPSPDVYLEAARRLALAPAQCVAVEDSESGIRAAHSAGMRVIAYPNRDYPPQPETLALAVAVVAQLADLSPAINRLVTRPLGTCPGV